LLFIYVMETLKKKILIVDETRFSRICSAILEKEGYETSAVTDIREVGSKFNYGAYELLVTSYPFCTVILEDLMQVAIPTIILSDHMNRDLMKTLDHLGNTLSHCMIKPIDYNKFRTIVKQVLSDRSAGAGRDA
jgi:DNA-binding NtrC family response regulator